MTLNQDNLRRNEHKIRYMYHSLKVIYLCKVKSETLIEPKLIFKPIYQPFEIQLQKHLCTLDNQIPKISIINHYYYYHKYYISDRYAIFAMALYFSHIMAI